MNVKLKAFSFLWLCLCIIAPVYSQQSVATAGGDASSSKGSTAFSVGQVAFISVDAESGFVQQGVQQPAVFQIVGVHQVPEDITIQLYPNPVSTVLYIALTQSVRVDHHSDQLTARMYDMRGHLVLQQSLPDAINSLPIDHLTSAMYLIQVWKGETFISSYSLIKSN